MRTEKRGKWAWGAAVFSLTLLAVTLLVNAVKRQNGRQPSASRSATSIAYRIAVGCGIVMPVRFRQVTVWGALREVLRNYYARILDKMLRFSIFAGPFSRNIARPTLVRMMGCKVGRRVTIGDDVLVDRPHSHMITIEDHAMISSRCTLIAHQRDWSQHRVGGLVSDCRYVVAPIRIGRGAFLGMGTIVCPGVNVGDGAVVGAGAVVTRDIPPYTVAAGVPARVLRHIPQPEGDVPEETGSADEES
jgi:acetyltransferase-like isoleucine patch superfamily enzyme